MFGPSDVGPNVRFYRGELRTPVGTVQEIHGWRGDYVGLEACHEYVQWLFPNYFPSRFNAGAFPLTQQEAMVFRTDRDIADNYLKSYELFLDFLGLEVTDRRTGEVRLLPGGKARLHQALVQNPHNQLRVRRLLASLAVTGFQRYMKPLVAELQRQADYAHGRRSTPPLAELSGGADSPLATWERYVDGNQEHFYENTRAGPADREQESAFFSNTRAPQTQAGTERPARERSASTRSAQAGTARGRSLGGGLGRPVAALPSQRSARDPSPSSPSIFSCFGR